MPTFVKTNLEKNFIWFNCQNKKQKQKKWTNGNRLKNKNERFELPCWANFY